MTNEERARILRMVAEGKISPVEAEDLLSALDRPGKWEPRATLGDTPGREVGWLARRAAGRSLVINVRGQEGTSRVNLRIPLGLARTAGRFLPRQAVQSLAHYDIDLDKMLHGVGDEQGTLLEVQDGDAGVRIAIE